MAHDHIQWVERLAYIFAGVAAVSLSQAAYALTIIATLLSIALAVYKLHDRILYGPARRD
jgi:Na+/H+ antiporter NhaB